MNTILLILGIILILFSLLTGKSIDISSILSKFKKDKTSEIKNAINDSKINETEEKVTNLNKEIAEVPKTEQEKSKDEVLKFWNKK